MCRPGNGEPAASTTGTPPWRGVASVCFPPLGLVDVLLPLIIVPIALSLSSLSPETKTLRNDDKTAQGFPPRVNESSGGPHHIKNMWCCCLSHSRKRSGIRLPALNKCATHGQSARSSVLGDRPPPYRQPWEEAVSVRIAAPLPMVTAAATTWCCWLLRPPTRCS